MRNILLDTGALVALLDRSERNHERCVEFYREVKGRFLTTEAVLTESLYLLGPSFQNQKTCIEFITDGGAILVPASNESLSRITVRIKGLLRRSAPRNDALIMQGYIIRIEVNCGNKEVKNGS